MNLDLYLNKKDRKKLEELFNFEYQRFLRDEIEKRPTLSNIVRGLINARHEELGGASDLKSIKIEEGEL